jgi:hypothetical protein
MDQLRLSIYVKAWSGLWFMGNTGDDIFTDHRFEIGSCDHSFPPGLSGRNRNSVLK